MTEIMKKLGLDERGTPMVSKEQSTAMLETDFATMMRNAETPLDRLRLDIARRMSLIMVELVEAHYAVDVGQDYLHLLNDAGSALGMAATVVLGPSADPELAKGMREVMQRMGVPPHVTQRQSGVEAACSFLITSFNNEMAGQAAAIKCGDNAHHRIVDPKL